MRKALLVFAGAAALLLHCQAAWAAKRAPRLRVSRLPASQAPARPIQFEEELPPPPPGELPPGDLSADELPAEPLVEIRPMTLLEFGRAFEPREGNYRVLLLHPCSGRPVEVCFSLPCGCVEEVNVRRREIEFEYDDYEVELRFRRDGSVRVVYDD